MDKVKAFLLKQKKKIIAIVAALSIVAAAFGLISEETSVKIQEGTKTVIEKVVPETEESE